MLGARRRPRAQGDEGVTLILMALSLVAILLVVALVLDYSNVRSSRQDGKLLADSATAAGLDSLAPDAVPRPWRAVCEALDYLKANEAELTLSVEYRDGAGTVLGGTPCTTLENQQCTPGALTSWAWIHAVAGPHTYDIKSGYVMPDANFPEDAGAYSGDVGTTTGAGAGGCDQIAVISSKTDPALFGGIGGATDYSTAIRTVGRIKIGSKSEGVPAFLMLERRACDTLSEQVGVGEAGIIVDPAASDQPGVIHVDSSGLPAAGCNGNNNSAGWAVYSSGNGGAKIVANPSNDGTPGIISIHALELGSAPSFYGGATAAGLSPAPTAGGVVSRVPVDEKYNPSTSPTITNIHSAGATDANRTSAPASGYPSVRPGSWTTLTCGGASAGSTATKIFVDCNGSVFSAGNPTSFPNATDIIFTGPVSVANNRQLYMPAARRIVVGGTPSNGGLMVAGGGRLGINSVSAFADTDAGVTAACTGREGPAWAQTTELVIFGGKGSGNDQGALSLGGREAMCQTFVYLGGPKTLASYAIQQLDNGTYDPSCLPDKPCAKTSGNIVTNAYLFVSGGLVQWSAPNQLTTQPAEGAAGVEDLALWTEGASLNEVKSGGDVRTTGVFFLPNARLEMRSPASATPRDAQFISRSMKLLQGTLRMKPTPNNAVRVAILESATLVR